MLSQTVTMDKNIINLTSSSCSIRRKSSITEKSQTTLSAKVTVKFKCQLRSQVWQHSNSQCTAEHRVITYNLHDHLQIAKPHFCFQQEAYKLSQTAYLIYYVKILTMVSAIIALHISYFPCDYPQHNRLSDKQGGNKKV